MQRTAQLQKQKPEHRKKKLNPRKVKEVEEIKNLLLNYPVLGIIDVEHLPARQLLKMRAQLRGSVLIRMSKARLIKIAMKAVEERVQGMEKLKEHVKGMPALFFAREDPFKLYKKIKKSTIKAPAKPGQKAPYDIVIDAGPTNFAPGPIISELSSFGLKTGIEQGKIVIKESKTVVKEGAVIDAKGSSLLAKFGIEPIEIGLNVVAVLDNGTLFTKSILAVDEEKYINDLKVLSLGAFNLAVKIGYASKDTINLLLSKAYREAFGLASTRDIITSDNVKRILAKAERQVSALKEKLSI